jgi:hypothetical protein
MPYGPMAGLQISHVVAASPSVHCCCRRRRIFLQSTITPWTVLRLFPCPLSYIAHQRHESTALVYTDMPSLIPEEIVSSNWEPCYMRKYADLEWETFRPELYAFNRKFDNNMQKRNAKSTSS